jgi:hypothetical protein
MVLPITKSQNYQQNLRPRTSSIPFFTQKTTTSSVRNCTFVQISGKFDCPVIYTGPDGRTPEAVKQTGRGIAAGSSIIETTVGLVPILIPGPTTRTIGMAIVAHGCTNLATSIASSVAYNKSDGNTELPTLAISISGDIGLVFKTMQDAGYTGSVEDIQNIFKTQSREENNG